MEEGEQANREVEIVKFFSGREERVKDMVAVEEPLEVRLDGHPVAVLMRTPGCDRSLVAGFLITEGILESPSQVRKFEKDGNRFLVFLNEGVRVDLGRLSRNMYAASSCGICGKGSLEAVFSEFPKLECGKNPSDRVILAAPEKLRSGQAAFSSTGGIHAAGLFDFGGNLLVLREDVGRHNAVDKVVGHALENGVNLTDVWLLVSGRISFEIMQKSLAVRIPFVAGISAPSSLAVDFAVESGQGLVGFLRSPGFNRYA